MSIRIDGTNTTANPGITGGDADTGLQFGTDEIQLVTGGTNRATVESNGNFTIEDGNLVVAAGHGIDFSATANSTATPGMDNELLDDYEEGGWTPAGANNFNGITQATGKYVKIGRTVFVTYQFSYSSLDTSSSDSAVTGLPFTVAENNPNTGVGATGVGFGSNKHVVTYAEEGTITLSFDTNTPITGTASTGGDFFRGSVWYYST